jgi:hypothetical protein
MGKIISPAGEIDFKMTSFRCKGNDIVVVGRMGMWDSEIYFPYKEMLRLALSWHLPQAIIMLPVALIRELFKRDKRDYPLEDRETTLL